MIQAVAYYGKLAIHPTPLATLADVWERAAIGPIPGGLVVAAGVLFHGGWAVFALYFSHRDRLATRATEPDCDGIAWQHSYEECATDRWTALTRGRVPIVIWTRQQP